MKDLIFKLVFENYGKEFIGHIRALIKDKKDFGITIHGFSASGFEYNKDGTVDIFLEIEDMEGNGGYAGCTFDGELKDILIDFMYSDGDQYQKWVYERGVNNGKQNNGGYS